MAGEWAKVALGEVVTLQRGFDLPSQNRKPGSVPIVSSSGITDYHSEVGAKGPGVVTGRYGTIGRVFLVREDYWPLNTTLWVKDFHGNDPEFASYLLRTIDFQSCSDKSSVPGVNRNDLHRIPVLRPPLAEQKAIAAVLGAIDAKIELNRQMNANLESMARALFQSWFVDFDPVRAKVQSGRPIGMKSETALLFPNSFQNSSLGQTPFGWKVSTLAEVCEAGGGCIQTGPFGTQLHASDYVDAGIPSIMPSDLRDNRIDAGGIAMVGVEDACRLSTYRVEIGDVVYSRRGDVEKRSLVRAREHGWLCGTG